MSNIDNGSKYKDMLLSFLPVVLTLGSVYMNLNNKMIVMGEQLTYISREMESSEKWRDGTIETLNDRETTIVVFGEKMQEMVRKFDDIKIEINGVKIDISELRKIMNRSNKRIYYEMPN